MDAQLFIGKVHIIEWLRPSDRRTGWELFGDLALSSVCVTGDRLGWLCRHAVSAEQRNGFVSIGLRGSG